MHMYDYNLKTHTHIWERSNGLSRIKKNPSITVLNTFEIKLSQFPTVKHSLQIKIFLLYKSFYYMYKSTLLWNSIKMLADCLVGFRMVMRNFLSELLGSYGIEERNGDALVWFLKGTYQILDFSEQAFSLTRCCLSKNKQTNK